MITRDLLLKKALKNFLSNEIHIDIIQHLQNNIFDQDIVLDIGCGLKLLTCFLNCKKIVGVDVYENYLTKNDILCDLTKIDEKIFPKSFDVVIGIDIIEHLEKKEAEFLLDKLELIAKRKIILFVPVNWSKNEDAVINEKYWSFNNKYNLHLSHWKIEEFLNREYKEINHKYKNDYIFVYKNIL